MSDTSTKDDGNGSLVPCSNCDSENNSRGFRYSHVDFANSLASCWAFNQDYQQSLIEFRDHLERKLYENKKFQDELMLEMGVSQNDIIPKEHFSNSISVFLTPYFKDIRGFHPPDNEDVVIKKMRGEINTNLIRRNSPWKQSEKDRLIESVHLFELKNTLKPLKFKENSLISKIRELEKTGNLSNELFELKFDLKLVEDKIKSIVARDVKSFVPKKEESDMIDWLEISHNIGTNCTPLSCELKWTNCLHPDINNQPWTSDEDERLKQLVAEHTDWDLIAEKLGTNRIGYQCFSRYQSKLNSSIRRTGPLSQAEIDLLNEIINNCRIGDYIPWQQVGYFMEGRTVTQLKIYWEKVNTQKKSEKWSVLEDQVLCRAVDKFGTGNWTKVARYIPGRTNRQCRERYTMRLGIKDRKTWSWSIDEDEKLLKLAPALHYRWAALMSHIEGRNAHQIAARYDLLEKTPIDISSNEFSLKSDEARKLIPRRTKRRKAESSKQLALSFMNQFNIENTEIFLHESRKQLQYLLNNSGSYLDASEFRGRKKRSLTEEKVDKDITGIFAIFSLYKKPFSHKGIARNRDDVCILNNLKNTLKCYLTNQGPNTPHLLSQVILMIIDKSISSKNSISSSSYLPPILPPNLVTCRGFHNLLLQSHQLITQCEEFDDDVSHIIIKPQYKKLFGLFSSLFYWPCFLSSRPSPERPRVYLSSKSQPKSRGRLKKKSRDILYANVARQKIKKLLSSANLAG